MGYELLRMPFEARFPFLDVRLLEFFIGAEDYVKYDKLLLREAMRGALPEPVPHPAEGRRTGDLAVKK